MGLITCAHPIAPHQLCTSQLVGTVYRVSFRDTNSQSLPKLMSIVRVKILRPPCNIQAALCPAGMSAGQPWAAQGPPRPVLCVLPSAARGLVLGLAGRSICGFCAAFPQVHAARKARQTPPRDLDPRSGLQVRRKRLPPGYPRPPVSGRSPRGAELGPPRLAVSGPCGSRAGAGKGREGEE